MDQRQKKYKRNPNGESLPIPPSPHPYSAGGNTGTRLVFGCGGLDHEQHLRIASITERGTLTQTCRYLHIRVFKNDNHMLLSEQKADKAHLMGSKPAFFSDKTWSVLPFEERNMTVYLPLAPSFHSFTRDSNPRHGISKMSTSHK